MQDLEHLGVLHTGEIPFVLNAASLWDYDEAASDAKAAALFGASWAGFAKTGYPGWQPFTETAGEMIAIYDGGITKTEDLRELRRKYREFWHELFAKKLSVI